jgi:hypothetical protein
MKAVEPYLKVFSVKGFLLLMWYSKFSEIGCWKVIPSVSRGALFPQELHPQEQDLVSVLICYK